MSFDLLMVDPPWPKKKGGLRKTRPLQGRHLDYAVMSVPEIFKLLDVSIFSQAAETHTVFMWTVDQFLYDAELEMSSRGYKRHARIIWNKLNGVAPCFTIRYTHEYLLWFYKPVLSKVAHASRGKHTTVITEKSREHSRKPDAAYALCDVLYPQAKKLDVFSREKRPGWEQFGNEVSKFNGQE